MENLLLTRGGTIKLCDFGSATINQLSPDHTWTAVQRGLAEDEVREGEKEEEEMEDSGGGESCVLCDSEIVLLLLLFLLLRSIATLHQCTALLR